MTTEQNMLDALIQHQVYSYRASTKVVNELQAQFVTASNVLSNRLRELLDELTDAEKNALTLGKYTTETLKEVKTAFDEWYQVMAVTLPETFAVSAVALAVYESSYISKLYGEEIELDGTKVFNQSKKMPVVGGQLYDDVWRNLSESVRKKALYAVREGISQGLTTAQIVSEIRGQRVKQPSGKFEYVDGIVAQAKNEIDANVRTVRSHVGNVAYQETFNALGFKFVKFFNVLDGRTSKKCAFYSNNVYSVDEPHPIPPLHFNCRSVLIGVADKSGKLEGMRPFVASDKPVSKIPKDQREGVVGRVDANTGFKEWFKDQDSEFQEDWLGKTRFKLYRDGGYSIDRFVDPTGNELTIAELKEIDARIFKKLNL